MPTKSKLHVIQSADLARFASALFQATGVARAMADEWAKSLVWANLRGVDSHGVLRIPTYLPRLTRKTINPKPKMRVEKRAGAIAVLEADRAPGAVAMAMAMDEAIARAREVHIGWCAAKNITHAGAVGYFALQAANAGMAGIVMSASGPMMAYHGAKVAGVSSNPLAIAFPAANRRPLLLDMSTSNVAMGKVMSARDAGRNIPLGWGLDAKGRGTTDPGKLATLLPLGGPKGSGLSLMIECLCSVAVGNPIIAPALAAGGARRAVPQRRRDRRRSRGVRRSRGHPRRGGSSGVTHPGAAAGRRRRAHLSSGRAWRRHPGTAHARRHSAAAGDMVEAGRRRQGIGRDGAVSDGPNGGCCAGRTFGLLPLP
jgi:LDH2 family malate/lactate/ureidoglycolate dehydrogenase